ncbi:MAG TPA: type III secretion protein [Myxococcales bacterium]|nr:type III secretion protein [Myxococcales bacterium]
MNPVCRAAVALLPVLLLSACQVEIQHQLTEREANEILVLLERKGIPTVKNKEEGGRELTWMISVPKAHAANAAMLLKENELPRTRSPGFEIFNRGSLIPTATEERAMFLQALAGELSKTICSIDGVLDARVHINIPQTDELSDREARPQPSASVLIKYRAYTDPGEKAPPPPVTDDQIQQLVARAVQDMSPEKVSVVMTPAAMHGGLDTTGPNLVEVLGVRMAADSVNVFRGLLAVLVLIILGQGGYIAYSKTREMRQPVGPAVRPRPRPDA